MGGSGTEEDTFHVLTAVMLTPAQYPGVFGDDYPQACAALGLAPDFEGYGLLFGQDSAGARWTVAVTDTALVACAIAAWDCGLEYDLAPPPRAVAAELPGWPLPLAVATPGLPEPHDPQDADVPPLGLPDVTAWGPAQRRLGADEIARRWSDYRGQVEREITFVERSDAPHTGVRRVLSSLEGYLADPPPPGRVRGALAEDGVPTLRADGPGWSVVARVDDIAFVLLDDEPGQIHPVGRGPALPALLSGLDALVAAPREPSTRPGAGTPG
ncbi:hypothetical protein GCM10027168_02920 [Streptomyces capparidis]